MSFGKSLGSFNNRRLWIAILLGVHAVLGSGCNLKTLVDAVPKAPTNNSAPAESGPTASISGSVLGGNSSGEASMRSLSFLSKLSSQADESGCSSGGYFTQTIGGGGAQLAAGTFTDGLFRIVNVPVQQELLITFLCADGSQMRCLAKSGDQGILCDSIADAVLNAFESALDKSVTHVDFKNKAITKVAASIVEAAQNDSTAADVFRSEIQGCRENGGDLSGCYRSTISASIFAGSFKMMQSMAQGWSVEAIFNLVTDVMGFAIDVDTMIYTEFGTQLDLWLDTDFIAQTRQFVSAIVNNQLRGVQDDSVIKLECEMGYSKYHTGGSYRFSPVLVEINGVEQPSCKNEAALSLNGLNADQINAVYAAMDSNFHDEIQIGKSACNSHNSWDDLNYYCVRKPRLSIVSKFKERNRNDLDGSQRDQTQTYTLGMIDVFPELFVSMTALLESPFNQTNHCADPVDDGPPAVLNTELCQNWFAAWGRSQKDNFSGLLGLYLFLKGPLSNPRSELPPGSLLSLGDIHEIFTRGGFLNSRLVAWGQGFNGRSNGSNRWMSPVLALSNGSYQVQDIFRWSYDFPLNIEAATALLDEAYNNAVALYRDTFAMFESVPTSDAIRNSVFGAAHHEEWNPLGSKFFNSAAVGTTGIPIFCKMTDKETGRAIERELNDQTRIECLDADQLTALGINAGVDVNGQLALPAAFAYPYVVQERGWMGDYRGRIYVLADRKTGQVIRPGDKEVLLEQLHKGNPDGECSDQGQANTVLTAKIRYGWGSSTREEAVKAYCLNMDAFTISSRIRFYWGGSIEITERDQSGYSWKWSAGQVGAVNTAGTNPTDIAPVCYFAPSGNLTIDAETKLVSSGTGSGRDAGAVVARDGNISSLGDGEAKATIASCSSNVAGATKYYIVQMGSTWESENKSDLRAYLLESGGANAKLMFQNWSPEVRRWEDLFVSLDASILENALNSAIDGSSHLVAPKSAPTYTQWVKLLNQKHDAKFDPYCDDITGPDGVANGHCDCYIAGTKVFKNPLQCTLEDDAAEPTISSAPYHIGGDKTVFFEELFDRLGGKVGEELHFANGDKDEFNGNYFHANQAWLNTDDVFQCAYLKTGETNFRKPRYIHWEGFWKKHEGCPLANGEMSEEVNGGGPLRFMNPKPMKNAYNIARPNTVVKLINYATKTVGQGVALNKTDKKFSFDEALALIALRYQMAPEGVQVLDQGVEAKGVFPMYESVRGSDDHRMDPASALLRGLTRPDELL